MIQSVFDNIAMNIYRIMVTCPPGGGKGDVICKLIVDFHKQNLNVLFVAHKTNLVYAENAIADRLIGLMTLGFIWPGRKAPSKKSCWAQTRRRPTVK